MAKKIYLSPSNQSGNKYNGVNTNECDQCNRIADAAYSALKRCGFEAKKAPKGQVMSKSISESNAWGADLHIPIHTNAGSGNGTMCMVYSTAEANMKLAKPIYDVVQSITPGTVDYGIRAYPQLSELCETNAIAVYIEVDFHDNANIAKWIVNNVKMVGEAIAKGVCSAYGVKYKAATTSSSNASNTAKQTTVITYPDRDKVLSVARSYADKKLTGRDICIAKLKLPGVVDWCAYAISAIMKECKFIGKYQGGIYGYASDAAREDHDKYGIWFKKGTKTPEPGDYIMFRYSSFTNPIDKYSASHVGLVEKVDGNIITTLEGNVDGNNANWAETSSYKRKTRYLSSSDVYAFYRPKWVAVKATKTVAASTTSSKKSIETIAKEVIAGKWGNGQDRANKLKAAGYDYTTVQNKVNELLTK